MNTEKFKKKLVEFHDKNYKKLLLIPLALFIFGFVYMGIFYSQNNDFIHKDISLTGGTSVTINDKINSDELKNAISDKLESVNVREISDLITREQIAVIVETKSGGEQTRNVLEDFLGYELNEENSSFEFTGSSLSENFYNQLLIAILIAFVLMALVVFVQFKVLIPSLAVIVSAFADIFFTLIVVNIFGIPISTAGIVAFLMLIGYSVDTDILLTNKVLRREGTVNKKIWSSFKTGITMTIIAFCSALISLFVVGSFSSVLNQIFLIMTIGLGFDVFNTWLTNVSIIKWYVLRKQKKNEN
ncbi:MAG: protein translocase subunit SecF [Candidatus Nanoarchaeia archaeon]|nr:protein translocase subunit SecF [Candidatus Nanoarchaeia archaeon]MDD5358096.1 protein translocase subunit SecF [Candidatus Nanoarchaeia archaeon]MDD5589284.1 protein translocase subunit SecF [Candidatus Nanoarchaeia archaeon]